MAEKGRLRQRILLFGLTCKKNVDLMLGYGVRLAMANLCWLRRTSVLLWLTKEGYGNLFCCLAFQKQKKHLYRNSDVKLGYGDGLAMAVLCWLRRTLVLLWQAKDGYGNLFCCLA